MKEYLHHKRALLHELSFYSKQSKKEVQMKPTTNSQGYWLKSLRKANTCCDPRYAPGKSIYISVVGVIYEGRLDVVAKLKIGEQVLLRREPTNPYDCNAIRVERTSGEQIGYIRRTVAAILVVSFDDFGEPVPGTISDLTPSSQRYRSPGVRVEFTVPETNQSQKGGIHDDHSQSNL
jgi:hypothetical protein